MTQQRPRGDVFARMGGEGASREDAIAKAFAVANQLTLDWQDGRPLFSEPSRCAGCGRPLAGGDTSMTTTAHVRWFCGPECIALGHAWAMDAPARAAGAAEDLRTCFMGYLRIWHADLIPASWQATGDYSGATDDDDHEIVIVEPRHLGGAIQPAGAGAAWFMRGSRFRDNWPVTFATDDAPAIAAAAFTRGRACVLVRHEDLHEEP